MINTTRQIAYETTNSFSKMVLDYVRGDEQLLPFYAQPVSVDGIKKARELGKARFEGRDYVMQDGDVVEFKIGN